MVTLPRFDLEQFLKTLATYEITHAFVVPPIVLALAHHPLVDSFDLSPLQLVFSGGAPLDADLAQACAKRLGVPVAQGYGMTELSPVSHAVPAGQTAPPGSVGPLAPSTECRVVDPLSGADVGVGAVGEPWIRGPVGHEGLPRPPGGDRRSDEPRGLAAHRRHRPGRRGVATVTAVRTITTMAAPITPFDGSSTVLDPLPYWTGRSRGASP